MRYFGSIFPINRSLVLNLWIGEILLNIYRNDFLNFIAIYGRRYALFLLNRMLVIHVICTYWQPQVSSASVNLTTETAIVWPVSEAKVIPNWQQQLGEELAKHLTNCGFKSNPRGKQFLEYHTFDSHPLCCYSLFVLFAYNNNDYCFIWLLLVSLRSTVMLHVWLGIFKPLYGK